MNILINKKHYFLPKFLSEDSEAVSTITCHNRNRRHWITGPESRTVLIKILPLEKKRVKIVEKQ